MVKEDKYVFTVSQQRMVQDYLETALVHPLIIDSGANNEDYSVDAHRDHENEKNRKDYKENVFA